MKPDQPSPLLSPFFSAFLLSFIACQWQTSAADVNWDIAPGAVGTGNGSITGGAGTWNTTNGNWTKDSGANNLTWTNGSDVAIFSNGTGVVSLGTAITTGGLAFKSEGYSVTGNTLTLTGIPVITVGTGFAATIGSVIGGTAGFTKSGSGTLTLTGSNTYSGATVVSSGVLNLEGNRNSNSGAMIIGNDSTQSGTLKLSNGNFSTGIGDIQLGTVAGGTGFMNQTSGTISTTPTSANNGRLLIGSAASSTGTYHLSGGTLIANGASTAFSNANAIILGTNSNSSGTFHLSGAGSLMMPKPIAMLQIGRSNSTTTTSSGTFIQSGGTASITNLGMGGASNSNTTSILNLTGGGFTVTDGFITLAAGDDSTASILIGSEAYLIIPGFPTSRGIGSTATLTFDGGTIRPVADDIDYISGLNSATLRAGGGTFAVTSGIEITVSQPLLADTASTGGGLTKAGLGDLTLSGINTYQGPTLVTGGKLIVTGEINSASPVTVEAGATLAGSGSVGGTILSPGTLAPSGTLTTGPVDLSGGILAIEVNGTAAGRLLSNGTINLSSTTLNVTENIAGAATNYVIAEGFSINGIFQSTNLPAGYSVEYTTSRVILKLALAVTDYPSWSAVSGLGNANNGPEMDPDGDGVKNLMEYVLGGSPMGVGSGDMSMLPTIESDENHLYFNFSRRSVSKDDTIQSVMISNDLIMWDEFASIGSISEGAVTLSGTSDQQAVSVAIPRSHEVDGRLFARLEVSADFPIVAAQPGMTEILRHWAPVVYQDVRGGLDFTRQLYGARDCIVAMNFDGDWDVANNWHNSRYQPHQQGLIEDRLTPPLHGKVYSALVESQGFCFLTYGFYHSGQDSYFSAARHQNDWETVVLVVRKDGTRHGKLEGMMTQFHTDQFSYLPSELRFSGHRPIIYIEPNGGLDGHGIKSYSNQNPGSDGVVYIPGSSSENVNSVTLGTSGNWDSAPRCQYKLIPISEKWGLIGRTGLNDPYAGWKLYNYARPANHPDYEHEEAGGNPPWDRDFFEDPFAFFASSFPALQAELAGDSYIFNPYFNGQSSQSGPVNANGFLPVSNWQKTQLGGTSGLTWHHRGETTLYHRNVAGADDRFTFSNVAANGDFLVQGRMHSVQDISSSRAGLMIRNSTADTSRMICLLVSADQRVRLQYRSSDGGNLSAVTDGPMPSTDQPVWLRLERKGTDIIASYSYQDLGGSFTVLANVSIAMDPQVLAGMAMKSSTATYHSAATMTDLEVELAFPAP